MGYMKLELKLRKNVKIREAQLILKAFVFAINEVMAFSRSRPAKNLGPSREIVGLTLKFH